MIGIVASVGWFIKLLYGAILGLFGFPQRGGWFVILMVYLFGYSAFLLIILGAIFKLIIHLALFFFLDLVTIFEITAGVYIILAITSLIYGISQAAEAIFAIDWEAGESDYPAVTNFQTKPIILEMDSMIDASESDSDGGDGGD